jgi:hypothetical protein
VTNWDPDDDNLLFLHQVATEVAGGVPGAGLLVLPNRPNPFNPSTVVPIRVGGAARVTASVYDMSGRLVRTLLDGWEKAGIREVSWDGTDASLRPVSSGVYFCRVEAGGRVETRRMVLVR